MRRREFMAVGTGLLVSSRSSPGLGAAEASSGGSGAPSQLARAREVLVVFFSRAGENYFNGGRKDLKVGNTAVVAGMIRQALRCEILQLEAVDPYPHSYDAAVQRNVHEQEADARPKVANLPRSIAAYNTILIGSPIWNVRPPRLMLTFAERYDFTGKTVHPFTTYAMSGLGSVVEEYGVACSGARMGEGLAIRGEEAERGRPRIDKWLRRIALKV